MLTQQHIDIGAVARNVIETLDSLESYLTSAMNPNRRALADLGLETMGWTKQAYSPKAFEIWQKQHQLEPDDSLTIHHMAIMHHARAFDLEAGTNPGAADADWKQAMTFWHRLYESAAFWDGLAAKACSGATNTNGVNELRTVFPQLILAVHYDIAFDDETREKRKSRAKFHIALAQNSPFDAAAHASARAAAYEKFILAIPEHVFKPDELREEELAKGTKVIEEYLLYDPGYQRALKDALQLQQRVQRARNIRWRSLDDKDPERSQILERERKDYEHWRPYFKQLVEVRDELAEHERENVAQWYFISGDSLAASGRREDALTCFETAIQVSADEDDRKRYQQRFVQTVAAIARAKAEKEDSGALAYCEKARARQDLTVFACVLLAQAFVTLSSKGHTGDVQLLDTAIELCQRGLAIEPDFDDLEADDHKEHLQSFLGIVELRKVMVQAQAAMQAEHHAEALALLDQAENLAREKDLLRHNNSIYWLRIQACLALRKIPEAKRDLQNYRSLLDQDSSLEDIEAGRRLEQMIAQVETMGDIEPLLKKARAALEGGRFAEALSPLNEAAAKAPRNDAVYFLRCQALIAVGNFAAARKDADTAMSLAETARDREQVERLRKMIGEAESKMAIKPLLDKAKQAMENGRFEEALTALNDAAKKDPRNDIIYFLRAQAFAALGRMKEAGQDAKKVAELAETEEDRKAARRLQEMLTRMQSEGGVSRLLKKAQSAMEGSRFSEAEDALDEAAKAAPETGIVYFLRAQARMGTKNFLGAMQDSMTFSKLAKSPEEKAAAKRLSDALLGGLQL